MIRYYSAAEVAHIWRHRFPRLTTAEVYRLASEHGWRKVDDRRRPKLYNGDDVDATMNGTEETT